MLLAAGHRARQRTRQRDLVPGAMILYVLWGSEADSATYVTISSFTYNNITSVPEPGSLALLGFGGLLAAVMRIMRTAG